MNSKLLILNYDMLMKKISFLMAGMACIMMTACSSSDDEVTNEENVSGEAKMVRLQTRSGDESPVTVEQVGVFMVYGAMQESGNYINNMLLQSNGAGAWEPQYPVFWKDNATVADFYGYAPYNSGVTNALAYNFQAQTDQSTAAVQKQSDFLWGKLAEQGPTDNVLSLTLNHLFARAIIKVAPGEGFTADELNNGTLSVRLNSIRTQATINLATGAVTASGNAASITPLKEQNLQYSAVVVPQQVASTGIVTVTWNNANYTLTRAMTFESGKQYTITVTMKKTSGGINIGIGDWEVVDEDFGGTVN